MKTQIVEAGQQHVGQRGVRCSISETADPDALPGRGDLGQAVTGQRPGNENGRDENRHANEDAQQIARTYQSR